MKTTSDYLNTRRVRIGRWASAPEDGNNGEFFLPYSSMVTLHVIASNGMDWDHLSVTPVDPSRHQSLYRTPTWSEMCYVKDLFFDETEAVLQLHPPKKQYRNAHEYCLHLWKPQHVELPLPEPWMVAPEGLRLPAL